LLQRLKTTMIYLN